MAKLRPQKNLSLHILAAKLECGVLSEEERIYLSRLLKRLANGEQLNDIIGLKNIAHRPNLSKTEQYVQEIYNLTQDNFKALGLKTTEAIEVVARAHNVSSNSVSVAYYSKKGREFLELIKNININNSDK